VLELFAGTEIGIKPGYVLKSYLIRACFPIYCVRAANSKINEDGREI
jgi:hypothetical protein